MEKYLSIPVLDAHGTNSQNQLVSITGVLEVKQTSSTVVDIIYVGGKLCRLTWTPTDTTLDLYEQSVVNAMTEALESGWTHVVHQYNPNGFVAGTPVPEETGSAANTNPLATIAFV